MRSYVTFTGTGWYGVAAGEVQPADPKRKETDAWQWVVERLVRIVADYRLRVQPPDWCPKRKEEGE